MIALLGFGLDSWLLDLSIAWGILCNVQGLAMTLLLPDWQRDVPTLFHAVQMRRQLRHGFKADRSFAPSRSWW